MTPVLPGMFDVRIEGCIVRFWLDFYGLHTVRMDEVDSEGRPIQHAPQRTRWGDLLAKSEKQLTLL